jgi:hypothetical protein
MDSTMNMMYVLADGSGSRPKSLFQFGSDTGESVYNLHVSQVGSSLQVGLGNEDFGTSFTTPITLTCKALTMAVGATTTCTAKVTASLLTPVLTLRSNHAGVFTTVKGTGAASVFSCKLVKGACSFKYKATSASSTTVITAAYPGDSNNLGGYAAFSLDVTLKTPKMTVSCKPISVVAGSSVNVRCTAKVTGYSTTGTITWSSTGPGTVSLPQGMTCTLTKGSCFVTFRGTSSGPVTIQASYGGDRNNAASTGTRNLTIK